MSYLFDYRPYQRQFRQPLKTSQGVWKVREGIILRLIDDSNNVGWGEISPIPWFGSETLEQALAFCQQLGSKITEEKVKNIPDSLPACQFGFESALGKFRAEAQRRREKREMGYSYLLPAGEGVLEGWQGEWDRGGRTFKWKIGVEMIEEEIKIFERLIEVLPTGVKLRLDANGGLSFQEAQQWLMIADEVGIIEFIEQPLAPQDLDLMLELSERYQTSLALDESVANWRQLEQCYQQGWREIFVVKAAIAGSPNYLRQVCQTYQLDTVFSSVFETVIGRQAVLELAEELMQSNRAVGFGVSHWFEAEDSDWLEKLWKNF